MHHSDLSSALATAWCSSSTENKYQDYCKILSGHFTYDVQERHAQVLDSKVQDTDPKRREPERGEMFI